MPTRMRASETKGPRGSSASASSSSSSWGSSCCSGSRSSRPESPSRRPVMTAWAIKATKQASSTAPSMALSDPPILEKSISSPTAATLSGISKRCVRRDRPSGVIMALIPRMSSRFAMQLPATLPNAMSAWPSTAETTLTTSSGMAVPTATTVRPMTRSGRPMRAAIWLDPSTSIFAPPMSSTKPNRIRISCRSMLVFLDQVPIQPPVSMRDANARLSGASASARRLVPGVFILRRSG